ncbi:50S ribosomal protein L1 [Candidatus Falkowbacteria bacterium]|nr:50S ribosomal protein L1 [Candidatus Falkowbacteria bacterium]
MTKKKEAAKTQAVKKEESKSKEEKKEFDRNVAYSIEEAIQLAKEMSKEKFDASIEAHFRLGIDPRKGDQQIRNTVSLPHGTGKTVRIAAFVEGANVDACKKAGADLVGSDDLIAEIKKTEKTDFQVAVAEPTMMKKLGPIAKILGTRGLMPSPKNDTVTPNPAKAVEELKKGKISFKNDDTSNIHVVIGKKSFKEEQLIENYNTLLSTIKRIKPASAKGTYIKSANISTSMGKGIKIDVA